MKDLIIFGPGGHAESLLDVVKYHSDWKVSYLIGKNIDSKRWVLLNHNFQLIDINKERLIALYKNE